MLDTLLQLDSLLSLLSLTIMEIVLGIDNIIFIAILVGKLPASLKERARVLSLVIALLLRLLFLFAISWLATLNEPLFSLFGIALSGKSLVMMLGGLFLMFKAIMEIHSKLEGENAPKAAVKDSLGSVLLQSTVLSFVFSIDSIITAIGLAKEILVMALAILISTAVMIAFAKGISDFIERHPTMKVLGLSMLLMIGVVLVAEGLHFEIPKGYMYFAIAFSLFVESINIRVRKVSRPIESVTASDTPEKF
ncbi:MAG: TerC family protein [Chloroherpetonaceae bacterium]|nr:TerC family protein [Chloroherpetonaceae bacterium]MCS7210160.1 TerC family protein [Chloroherpetonaceae bacterium]MDW8019257.1 TerC family protein [Chloroherpetonaceae bacterium]